MLEAFRTASLRNAWMSLILAHVVITLPTWFARCMRRCRCSTSR
jgi:hypothetical protein